MRTNLNRRLTIFILFFFTGHLLMSCVNTKKAIYFQDLPKSLNVSSVATATQTIHPGDILGISVSSLNAEANIVFNNQPTHTVTGGSSATQLSGYLVDEEGVIQFPVLGKITAAGLTKKQFTEFIRSSLIEKKFLLDPVVTVWQQNFKVTVLGEVARPAVFSIPNEKVSLLEAIGMAGDLTIYAKRDNVVLIREEGGEKTIQRIDLNSKDIFQSPYYYLRSNDVIYVEPNKTKIVSASNTRQILPMVLSGLSFIAIIIDRATR